MEIRKNVKRIISLLIVVFMIVTMIPVNVAYAAPGVKSLVKTRLNYSGGGRYTAVYDYNGGYNQIPNDNGPVYRNPANKTGAGDWGYKTVDKMRTVYPGETDNASMGFAVDLEAHNMLGSSLKSQLVAINKIGYDNYKGDSDYGQPFVSLYNRNGNEVATHWGAAHDVSDWINNEMQTGVRSDTAYIIFAAYGKRSGGLFNKELDFNLRYIQGSLSDLTAPWVVSATNDWNSSNNSPLQLSPDAEVIKQNTNAQEPNIYITMSEDCTFPNQMNVTLYATDGTQAQTNLIQVGGKYNTNYSNGDMTYKFRVNVEDLQNRKIFKHFTSMSITNFVAADTFNNSYFKVISIQKRIDVKAPTIVNINAANTFKVSDEFGLSLVKYDMSLNGITNSTTVVNYPKTTPVGTVPKESTFSILNTTKYSDVFTIVITASDMVYETNTNRQQYNNSTLTRELFLISNSEALRFSLKNSDNPMLNVSASDVGVGTTKALTNMYFKSSLNSNYIANDTVIYYKWSGVYDDSILTQTDISEANGWNQVKFKSNSSETEAISVPVESKIDEVGGSYLAPVYKDGGYLYIIPKIKDDTTNSAQVRTGSMASDYMDRESLDPSGNVGFFKLNSNPVAGNFVNRGCDCTGQGTLINDITHYNYYGNHKNDIGFDVINNTELVSLKFFISEGIGANKSSSYLAQGSFNKNDTGIYNIPITPIVNKTGEYTLTVGLYSSKGDVTVRELPIKIENPIIGVSNILYNQATKNLDFTITYSKNSLVSNAINDIQIEFVSGDIIKFTEKDKGAEKSIISLYAITEDAVIPKEDWGSTDKAFFRSEFEQSVKDSNLMTASFRASLTNMEKAGDAFIKAAGEKRVHLKYTSSNRVKVYNNNVTVIKKSNLPPSVRKTGSADLINKYMTATEFNSATDPIINIDVDESIVELKRVHYAWVESADSSLIIDDDNISGTPVTIINKNKVVINPKDIPSITGDSVLYKPYFLVVYAENIVGKFIENSFGPFYVLNENINEKRFEITVSDEGLSDDNIFVAVDDKLHMISELDKADKIKLVWKNGDKVINKVYDISFIKGEGTTNLAYVNAPYIDLIDTNGEDGTYILDKAEIINSSKSTTIKTISTSGIERVLPKHFVSITMLGDEGSYTGVNVKSDAEVQYSWSHNPYIIPNLWNPSNDVSDESGENFITAVKKSLVYNRNYLYVKKGSIIYKSYEVKLQDPDPTSLTELTGATVRIGEAENGYLGVQDGAQENVMIRVKVADLLHLNSINKIDVFDLYSGVSSSTAISVNNVYKISNDEVAGFIPSLVTSGGAINCKVSINGFTAVEVKSNRIGELTPVDLTTTRGNRTITLTNKADYLKYSLYQSDGNKYTFNSDGKTTIFENGKYLLVYTDTINKDIYTKEVEVSGIEYSSTDVSQELSPIEVDGKVTSVNAKITMPYGSVINDKYGVISSIVVDNDKKNVVATAVITRSAIYSFDITFTNKTTLENYTVNATNIIHNYVPESTDGVATSINYSPEGPTLTIQNVTATVDDINAVLSNDVSKSIVFDKNGSYSIVFRDNEAAGKVKVYTATVDWIDKKCPNPKVDKYIWYDFDSDGIVDDGEKGASIAKGYKTKNNMIVEIMFPKSDRPVKLSDASGFVITEPSSTEGYSYTFTYAYNEQGFTPVLRRMLVFEDTLGNTLHYNLIIDEIDRTSLLTQLNYSTTHYTNRDVVVSMSANKSIKRFDIVQDEEGNDFEREASPTYVFKENGTKDFNYREIQTDDPIEGKLVANVTWIDKNVPVVKVSYDTNVTNQDVVINFTVLNGVALKENAKLKYGTTTIPLIDSGDDRVGTYTVTENGNFNFTVMNKYGNTGSVIVPINNIDKRAPEISISGRATVFVKVGDNYYDKGATALDNRDGNITTAIKASSNVNTLVEGEYEVVYTVSDTAGNSSTKSRTVKVLNINSAVAIIQDNVIDLKSSDVHQITLSESGIVYVEIVGIEGKYITKYAKGDGFDNAYFKKNGSYLSKLGTFTAEKGKYTFYVQDQERNTRIITLEFK